MVSYLSIDEVTARLVLHSLSKIGSKRFHQLLTYFGSAKQALIEQKAWRYGGLPESCQNITLTEINDLVDNSLMWLEQPQHHLLFSDDEDYPSLLKEISDPPPVLFIEGNKSILEKPQLAIVGSRHASKPGLDTSFQFAKQLAINGFVITSGLALGIDGAAHRGALAGHGLTIAVLGCGLQQIYPVSHYALASDIIAEGGALITEFPLNAAPQAANFPRRNRIISGLALGTLIVEATLSSGSLITAKLAAEQGREVFAIPGSIHHPASKGCHQLIREGAMLVESIDHILEALQGWTNIARPDEAGTISQTDNNILLQTLRAAPQTSEVLASSLNIPFEKVLIELTELELAGKVTNEAGIWYAC